MANFLSLTESSAGAAPSLTPEKYDYCPLFRAEFNGELPKLHIKPHVLPQDVYGIQGDFTYQARPITLQGQLDTRYGQWVLAARLTGLITQQCSRTGQWFLWYLDETVVEILVETEEPELFPAGVLDMAEWARQQVELALPTSPIQPQVYASGGVMHTQIHMASHPFEVLKQLKRAA